MANVLSSLSLYVQSAGWMGAVLYIGVFMTLTMLFFPASLLTALAGLLFGVTAGTLIALLGGVASSLLAFGIGRSRLYPLVAARLGSVRHRMQRRISLTQHNSMMLVLLLRLSSVVPFAPLNYGLGASGIKFKKYLIATVPGLIPGTFIYASAGAAVADVNTLIRDGVSPTGFIHHTGVVMGTAGVVLGLVLLYLLQRSLRKKTGT